MGILRILACFDIIIKNLWGCCVLRALTLPHLHTCLYLISYMRHKQSRSELYFLFLKKIQIQSIQGSQFIGLNRLLVNMICGGGLGLGGGGSRKP